MPRQPDHQWATAPATAIVKGVMGIKALTPAFKTFQVKPQPGNLTWASIKVPTIAGFIAASFNSTAADFKLTLSVPANTKARVCLPTLGLAGTALQVDGKQIQGALERDYVCVDGVGSSTAPHVVERKR